MKRSLWLVCLLFGLLFFGSCQKKQDLVHKAFDGKNFDKTEATNQNQVPKDEVKSEEKDPEQGAEVLVDNLVQPPESSEFITSGELDPVRRGLSKVDPPGPIFNFDETSLYEIIRVLCDALELNCMMDPSIADAKNISINMVNSDKQLKTSQLFDIILKLHDLTMVQRDPFIYIVPKDSNEALTGLEILYGSKSNEKLRREEVVIQIIPLKYVKPADISNALKEFLSPGARIIEEPINNILIIIDEVQYLARVMELIPVFDVDVLANKKMVYYQLAYVDGTDVATKLEEIMTVYGYESGNESLNIIPIESLNGILVVSKRNEIFKEIDFWLEKFDKEAQFEEEQVFVYNVENTTADSIAQTISQLLGLQTSGAGRRGGGAASNRRTTNPTGNAAEGNQIGNQQQRQRDQQSATRTSRRGEQNNLNNGEGPQMIVDEDNNALIFRTTPREYLRINKVLRKLDILPRQVFLEVTVLSVELTDTFNLGLNWSAEHDNGSANTRQQTSSAGWQDRAFSGAYTYTGLTTRITASINAAKNKGYANVLQQPHIMAIDNKSATISVGQDVPIITTTNNIGQVAGGQGLNPASSSTIQYRPTGVSLGFTPHINANGLIRLEINLSISEAGSANAQGGVPISQNALETEMIVRDNQTVVMGGLIFDAEDWDKFTVPFLDRIPLIRHLFTDRTASKSKRELIVMITPHVIDTEEKSISISKEFKDKILKEFDSFRDQRY